MAPKVEEIENSKEQTLEHYKANSQSLKKFYVYCYVANKIQR
jgi:hypothetical protein